MILLPDGRLSPWWTTNCESVRRSTISTPTQTKHTSQVTTNHDEIQRWAEERGAQPACVRGTSGQDDVGRIRPDFPGYTGEGALEHIEWNEWFETFDDSNLALVYQEETADGEKSNFNKSVSRDNTDASHSATSNARSKARPRRSTNAGGWKSIAPT